MKYDIIGIGNAIVDVLAKTDDDFLQSEGLNKGGMALIDAKQADILYGKMAAAHEISGGSVANTCAGLASLGGKSAFVGRVCDDQLGEVFAHDIKAAGVEFIASPGPKDGPPTARCLVLVTPDAQRTMNTYLGACVELGPNDIDESVFGQTQVTYLEGYLWDQPLAKEAMLKAAVATKKAGNRVALTLSDAFCVDRHRESFKRLISDHVDILFANEAELLSLTQEDDFERACEAIEGQVEIAAVTRSEAGSVVLTQGKRETVPAGRVEKVVDTTGAGDLYAAGFLFGLTKGQAPAECARLGGLAAAEVISHYGARPEVTLSSLL